MTTAAAKKFRRGQYELHVAGRVFEIEDHKRVTDGEGMAGWMVYERFGNKREYLNDYRTKRDAIARTVAAVKAGF